jgi:ribonuclease P protein component
MNCRRAALASASRKRLAARRLREMVRCHRLEIPAGWDIVIHPKSSVARAEFAALTADLLRVVTGFTLTSK